MYFKEFREYLGLTQKDMADKLNMAQNALARYELGNVNPGSNVIQKYIDEFSANPNFLFLGIRPYIIDDIYNIDSDNVQLLNELGFLLDKKDINIILKEKIFEQIIQKFNDIETTLFVKLLSFLEPERPLLFLYYLVQIINHNSLYNKNLITNHVEYLCSIIKRFPAWKFFINQKIFTKRIQNQYIETIRTKIEQNECKIIVNNSKQFLELLELKLPSYIITNHKLKTLELEKCLLVYKNTGVNSGN